MSEFKKTSAQIEATRILSGPAKHIALSGGSRAGKSVLLMYAMIVRCAKVKSRHCIFRLNFNHVKRSIVLETFPKVMAMCFPDLKYKLNRTDYIVEFPNGSQIFFAGLDSGDRVEKVLGSEFSGLWFNEISQIPYASVQIALTRLAEKNDLSKKVYYDMNPSDKGSWPYYLFVKKLDPIDNIPLENPDDYAYFRMNPESNLENIDADYLKMLAAMPEKDRLRFLHGEFGDSNQGSVYYSFDREKHVAPTKIENGTLLSFHDFNLTPMTALIAQFIDNKFYIHDEIWLENSDTFKMCAELKSRGYKGTTAICDSTGANRKTSGQSDFDIMKQNGITILTSHNPLQRDRANNANRILSDDRVVINPKCKKLINDLSKVCWKDEKIWSGTDKMLGHISDCLSYGLWKLDPIGLKSDKYTMMAR